MFEEESQNYYDILDIKPDATLNDVRQAYLRTKQAYSRDSAALYSLFDEEQTKQVLARVEEAFVILSNPEKRKEYDKVHGFLSPAPNFAAPAAGKAKGGSFSFESGLSGPLSSSPQGTGASAGSAMADDLAKGVFAGFDESEAGAAKKTKPAVADAAAQSYATPRTLAESSAFKETNHDEVAAAQSISSWDQDGDPSWKANQNKLGIVRRVDLIKPFSQNADMEKSIAEEKEFSGEFLKKVREYRRINLDELSEFTKISKNYLHAVETENHKALPAAVYVRGFVFQIAKTLKLPYDKAANAYINRFKSQQPKD